MEKPPLIQDVLAKIIAKAKGRNHLPAKPFEAAHWWVDHQEKPKPYRDDPEPVYQGEQVTGWLTPYHDRLSSTLRIYLSLSEPQQVYVTTQIEAGIPWRGDSIEAFANIVAEHKKMLEDKESYIGKASQVLKELFRGK